MPDTSSSPLAEPQQARRKHRFDDRLDEIITNLHLNGAPGDTLLRDREVELLTSISRSHLAAMRCSGDGPAFIKTGTGGVRYRLADLRQWFLMRRFNSTAAFGGPPAPPLANLEPLKNELKDAIERNRGIADQFLAQANQLADLLSMLDEPATKKEPAPAGS